MGIEEKADPSPVDQAKVTADQTTMASVSTEAPAPSWFTPLRYPLLIFGFVTTFIAEI